MQWPLRTQAQLILLHSVSVPGGRVVDMLLLWPKLSAPAIIPLLSDAEIKECIQLSNSFSSVTFSQYEDYTPHAAIAVGLLLYLYCIKSAFISLKNNNNKKWPENCSSVPGLFNIQDVNSFPKLIHFNTNCIQNLEGRNAVGAHLMSLLFVKNSSHYLYSYSLIRKPSIWSTSISVTVQFVILTDPFAPGNPISP